MDIEANEIYRRAKKTFGKKLRWRRFLGLFKEDFSTPRVTERQM
jgi:hypothetical protein